MLYRRIISLPNLPWLSTEISGQPFAFKTPSKGSRFNLPHTATHTVMLFHAQVFPARQDLSRGERFPAAPG